MLKPMYSLKTTLFLLLIAVVSLFYLLKQFGVFEPKYNPVSLAKQLVVVTSKSWSADNGTLQRFERKTPESSWVKVGEPIGVTLGENGMGWGIGAHGTEPLTKGPIITEGARRSPAGAFDILIAFGKDPKNAWGVKLPYKQVSSTVYCPDDPKSKHYNRLVDIRYVPKDWDSAEDMQRFVNDGIYSYGIMISHNFAVPIPNRGSCFFLRTWISKDVPTVGSTAMDENDLKAVITWIDPHKDPMLIQLPEVAYSQLKSSWNLPKVN